MSDVNTVSLESPSQWDHPTLTSPSLDRKDHDGHRSKNILIVDDEADLLQMIKWRMEFHGYQVDTAMDGQTALERAFEHPDLILLDIILPMMSGLTVAKIIKEDAILQDIPIIFMTALDGEENKIDAIRAGGDGYLVKPINNQELIKKVRFLL